jgi:hypothetical protein
MARELPRVVAPWPSTTSHATFDIMARDAALATRKLCQPHPDDEAEVCAAIASVDRGELLSVEASESFLRWLEGSDDESWRAECGSAPGTHAPQDRS